MAILLSHKELLKLKYRDTVIVQCDFCSQKVTKIKKHVMYKNKPKKHTFCSVKCSVRDRAIIENAICRNCDSKIYRAPSQQKKTNNVFCSSSCSATWNNKHRICSPGPKRTIFNYCVDCGIEIERERKRCHEHRAIRFNIFDKTISELKKLTKHWKARIRMSARATAKNNNILKSCFVCNYSKHVEACHIKPIASFLNEEYIRDVNSLSNLIGLCRTHHWELDHNLMEDSDQKKLNKLKK